MFVHITIKTSFEEHIKKAKTKTNKKQGQQTKLNKIHPLPKKTPKQIKNIKKRKNLTNKQRVQSEITYLSYTIL